MKNYAISSLWAIVLFGITSTMYSQEVVVSNIRHSSGGEKEEIIKFEISNTNPDIYYEVIISMVNEIGENIGYTSENLLGEIRGKGPHQLSNKNYSFLWYYGLDGFEGNIKGLRIQVKIKAIPSLVASFIHNAKDGMAAPAVVTFKNTTSINADSYSWDFGDPSSGDDNTSTLRDDSHEYSTGNSYTVTLICTTDNPPRSDTIVQEILILSPPIRPEVSFSVEGDSTPAPARIRFRNASKDADVYKWNFGDTDSDEVASSEEMIEYTYKNPGNYTVNLTGTNLGSGLNDFSEKTVRVLDPPKIPEAKFEIKLMNKKAPFDVRFINNSKNCDRYEWNFDDPASKNDNTSELKSPEHKFKKPIIYSVELIGYNSKDGLKDSISIPVILNMGEIPKADISYDFSKTVKRKVLFFSNSSSSDSYKWDFGDPESGKQNYSKGKNPVHTFSSADEYEVKLEVKNDKSGEIGVFTTKVNVKN